jgi:metal-responsive CopG/Arc/MetJ family transcriptional regulator
VIGDDIISRHGKSRKGIKTASVKLEDEKIDKIDEIKVKEKLKSRSDALRLIIDYYLSRH